MTSKPSLFWVDPDSFSELIRRTKAPGGRPARSSQTAMDHEPRRETSTSSNQGQETGRLPETSGQLPAGGSLEERLTAVLGWSRSQVRARHAFIVDSEGLAVVAESSTPLELIAAAAEVGELWDSLRRRFALSKRTTISLQLEGEGRLHLFSNETDWGRLSLGLVTEKSISQSMVVDMEAGFEKALLETE